jgi:hypothetical protein
VSILETALAARALKDHRPVVIVYRSGERQVDTQEVWHTLVRKADTLTATASRDDRMSLFIDVTELEAAIADALWPVCDGVSPQLAALRGVSVAAADMLLASTPATSGAAISCLRDGMATVPRPLPSPVSLRVSEGYAFYGLDPSIYAQAVRRFAAELSPSVVHVLGIRGIGAGLSAVAGSALRQLGIQTYLYTVRPHGHPFDRHAQFDDTLTAALRRQAETAHFAIVDEGPGLSGSTFAAVADALLGLGIDRRRVVMLPSWDADPRLFRSSRARQIWTELRAFPANDDPSRVRSGAREISAGRWREALGLEPSEWPAVHPHHEARKFLDEPTATIARFAGFGRYGEAKETRAQALADAGLGPAPLGLSSGYLELPFLRGRLASAGDAATLAPAIGRYIADVARLFPAARRTSLDDLDAMIEHNVRTVFNDLPRRLCHVLKEVLDERRDAQPAWLDGRILPHEWVTSAGGCTKVDALDHHDDHFFPGPQDPAWDLASADVEWQLSDDSRRVMLEAYGRVLDDESIAERLPYFRVAYLAFRLGYCTLAIETLGQGGDGARFERLRHRYRRQLGDQLAIPSAP